MSSLRPAAFVLAPSLVCLALACGSALDRSEAFTNQSPTDVVGSSGSSGFGSSGAGASDAGGATCAAVAAKTAKAKVDIIFVIDDSGSMTEEMTQIKTNVNTFASKIASFGLDYTVTFIVRRGTSGNTICVPPPLGGPSCSDNPPTFHHVDFDVQSTDSFALILGTYDNTVLFRPTTPWKGYLRMDATKVFIEVSDDTSDVSETQFDAALLAKAPAGMFGTAADRHYIWHSIVSKPAAATAPSSQICSTAAGPSMEYQRLSILTKGIIEEVCKTDYSAVLGNIAKGITDKLGCELQYPSSAESDPTKLVVTFTPNGQPPQPLTQVTAASKCGSIANAWYYDDPAKPSKIILCPSTCTAANASPDAKLEALVGCKAAPPS